MEEEPIDARCPGCGYLYEWRYERHRQDARAVEEDGKCTWCHDYAEALARDPEPSF